MNNSYRAGISRRTALGMSGAVLLSGSWQSAEAEEFPTKPLRFVVPASPGGATDGISRAIGNGLNQSAGWTVVMDNLPGVAGNIGLAQVAKAPRDGYTLAIGESSNLTVNQFLYKSMPFDPERDIAPVMLVARVPLLLVVPASGAFHSAAELAAEGRRRSLSYASPGNGTLAHLTAELWKQRAGVRMEHIPYKSAPPAMTDLAAGLTDLYFASIASASPMLSTGKVRALAILSSARSPQLPNVPTFAEAGFSGMDASALFGVVTTSGTPAAIIDRLNRQLNIAIARPDVIQQLVTVGADRTAGTYGGDPSNFSRLLQEERIRWGKVVKASGAKID